MRAESYFRKRDVPGLVRTVKQVADYSLSSSAGIEIVVLFTLLLAAQHLMPGSEALNSISPHPYWTAVLLLSVRHGTSAGLAAALVAIVLYLLHGVPLRSSEEDYYTYTLRIWREPMLWLVAALIVGEIRLGQIEERNTLATMLREAERQRSIIAQHWGLLAGHVEDLERSMATHSGNRVDALLEELALLQSRRLHVATSAFQRIAAQLLGEDARIAFWRPDHTRAAYAQTGTFGIDMNWSRDPDCSRPVWSLSRALVSNTDGRHVFSIAREADREALKDAGVLACSVVSSLTGRVHGALVVQHIDLDRLTPAAETALLFLSRELATSLDRNRMPERTGDSEFGQRRAS
jgi:hypothetical protein